MKRTFEFRLCPFFNGTGKWARFPRFSRFLTETVWPGRMEKRNGTGGKIEKRAEFQFWRNPNKKSVFRAKKVEFLRKFSIWSSKINFILHKFAFKIDSWRYFQFEIGKKLLKIV